mmetsp:Transcript_834/g.1574  ORF Transcript_834/g.1574 Transcript_834/m.1574 type:complete len:88 (+) Transcript_834:1502-1765(+)
MRLSNILHSRILSASYRDLVVRAPCADHAFHPITILSKHSRLHSTEYPSKQSSKPYLLSHWRILTGEILEMALATRLLSDRFDWMRI